MQYFPQVLSVLLDIGKINQDVVQKDKDESVQVVTQEIVHHVHELRGGVGQPKGHYKIFVESPSCLECCLVNVSGPYQYLPISQLEVDLAAHLGIPQLVEHFLREWGRIPILDRFLIQPPVINAKT